VIPLILLFAAAGSTPAVTGRQPAPAKALSACSAVSAADVERALGRAFSRGQEEVHGTDSTCDYTAGNGQVSITIQRLPAKADLPVEIAALQRTIEGSSVRPANGIGTEAFFLDIANAGTQLHVIRGEREYVMISVLGFGDAAEVSPVAEKLARAALGKL
jgi:hypothetical protein